MNDLRPHRYDTTEVIKCALRRTARDARRYAATGPKWSEDVMHQVADQFLDELRDRGELR